MKEKFFRGVVKHRKPITVFFLICVVVCAYLQSFVSVNYDMNDYLPEDTASTVSLDKMEEEFGSGIPNARVMIQNVTVAQALEKKEELEKIDGVSEVIWLDDVVDITIPLEMVEEDIVDDYYKEETALYSVTIEEEKTVATVDAIRELIGKENAMTGIAVDKAVATTSTTQEIGRIVKIAVVFVLFILFLTTTSWFEPVILLLSIGIAVIINAGTNLIFGEISFVTNAAGNILQLAVSLDYSVFLLHRFKELRREIMDPEEAMVQALCKSTNSILSSGLTTVIGFLALALMRFQIGPDLGLALAKGIALSLIVVFVLSPGLILYTHPLLEKTSHKEFMPSFNGFGKLVKNCLIPFSIIFAILIIPSYLSSVSNSYYYGSSHIFGEDTKLGKDTAKIEKVFGLSNSYVLMVPEGDFAKEKELSDALKEIPQVSSILSYVDNAGAEVPTEYVDEEILSKLLSDHYSRMVITVETDYEGEEAFSVVEQMRSIANEYYPDMYYLAGATVSTYDLMETVTADMISVNLVSIGAVFIVLLFSLKSISLPVILVLAIETTIWLNLSVPYYADAPVFYIAYLIISSIQLGATVDYAILMTDRYLEYRQNCVRGEAIGKTISSVMVAILTSGTVLTAVGFFLGKMTTHGLLAQLGMLIGRGTLCSLIMVVFVVPGLLYLFDRVIEKTTRGIQFYDLT